MFFPAKEENSPSFSEVYRNICRGKSLSLISQRSSTSLLRASAIDRARNDSERLAIGDHASRSCPFIYFGSVLLFDAARFAVLEPVAPLLERLAGAVELLVVGSGFAVPVAAAATGAPFAAQSASVAAFP